MTLVDAPVLAVAADRFEEAAPVVQALGRHGQAPDLYVDGALVRPGDSPGQLLADDDGALPLHGVAHPLLSVLRVETGGAHPDRPNGSAVPSNRARGGWWAWLCSAGRCLRNRSATSGPDRAFPASLRQDVHPQEPE
ncbi:hypothetical protein ACFVTC_02700 [Streptomyces sp. NPDC057950]|uniref:hypothetical protein n=1 Tax=Streptomyces sp. NPDC057950 TaxID=3346288 RepID=UPI0036E41733